jgi:hypothetical protein
MSFFSLQCDLFGNLQLGEMIYRQNNVTQGKSNLLSFISLATCTF